MKIKDQILKWFQQKGDLSVKELVDELNASKQGIHVAFNQLLEHGNIVKFGKAPKTIYRLASDSKPKKEEEFDFLSH